MAGRAQRFDSRQCMKNKHFEVFHYREKRTENVDMHHHDFYEVYFLLNGRVSFLVEGESYILEPGDLLLINPQELHRAQIEPDTLYERMILWIDRNHLARLCTEDMDLTACFNREFPEHTNIIRPSKGSRVMLGELLEKLNAEFYSSAPGNEIYAQGLLMQFMVELNRLSKSHTSKAMPPKEPDLISRVLLYIGSHYCENISLASIAEEFYVSKYYLSHEFRRRIGTGVYQYIIFRRLMQARELMTEGQSPGEVYQNCGFGDYANFYRAFKSEYGISPREFVSGFSE